QSRKGFSSAALKRNTSRSNLSRWIRPVEVGSREGFSELELAQTQGPRTPLAPRGQGGRGVSRSSGQGASASFQRRLSAFVHDGHVSNDRIRTEVGLMKTSGSWN